MPDIAGEVARLRTEIEMLTQGLVLQQQFLVTMDEKLDLLLEAASGELAGDDGHDPLAEALRLIIGLLEGLTDGQRDILKHLNLQQAS